MISKFFFCCCCGCCCCCCCCSCGCCCCCFFCCFCFFFGACSCCLFFIEFAVFLATARVFRFPPRGCPISAISTAVAVPGYTWRTRERALGGGTGSLVLLKALLMLIGPPGTVVESGRTSSGFLLFRLPAAVLRKGATAGQVILMHDTERTGIQRNR